MSLGKQQAERRETKRHDSMTQTWKNISKPFRWGVFSKGIELL